MSNNSERLILSISAERHFILRMVIDRWSAQSPRKDTEANKLLVTDIIPSDYHCFYRGSVIGNETTINF